MTKQQEKQFHVLIIWGVCMICGAVTIGTSLVFSSFLFAVAFFIGLMNMYLESLNIESTNSKYHDQN